MTNNYKNIHISVLLLLSIVLPYFPVFLLILLSLRSLPYHFQRDLRTSAHRTTFLLMCKDVYSVIRVTTSVFISKRILHWFAHEITIFFFEVQLQIYFEVFQTTLMTLRFDVLKRILRPDHDTVIWLSVTTSLRETRTSRLLLQENVWSVNDITNSSYRRYRSRRLKWSRPEVSDISWTDTNFVDMKKIYTTHFHDILWHLCDIRWTIR